MDKPSIPQTPPGWYLVEHSEYQQEIVNISQFSFQPQYGNGKLVLFDCGLISFSMLRGTTSRHVFFRAALIVSICFNQQEFGLDQRHSAWDTSATGAHAALFERKDNVSMSYGFGSWIRLGVPRSNMEEHGNSRTLDLMEWCTRNDAGTKCQWNISIDFG
ncbi:hypothetical protein Pfo_000648 [Paulownia fortunei]|nr:hypothetical protein Pfo_000648 [Paulownia fortunei]